MHQHFVMARTMAQTPMRQVSTERGQAFPCLALASAFVLCHYLRGAFAVAISQCQESKLPPTTATNIIASATALTIIISFFVNPSPLMSLAKRLMISSIVSVF